MRIGIFYFTGTGNTEFIARELKASFGTGHHAEIFNIENITADLNARLLDRFDLVCFGAPVYAFNAPRFFIKFIQALPEATNNRTFLFLNAGGDAFAALDYPRAILKNKGYQITNEAIFYLPGNILISRIENQDVVFELVGAVFKYNIKQMFDECQKRIRETTSLILRNEKTRVRSKFWQQAITLMLQPMFYVFAALQMKWFTYANNDCNACGLCVRACPTRNITMSKRKVKFDDKCTICYRCFNFCPKMAIHLHWPFGFLDNKAQYLAPGWRPPFHDW